MGPKTKEIVNTINDWASECVEIGKAHFESGKVNGMHARERVSGMSMPTLSLSVIITFAIGLIVMVSVVPEAITTFYGTNTSTWAIDGTPDTKTQTLWWLLPLIIVAGIIAGFVYSNRD